MPWNPNAFEQLFYPLILSFEFIWSNNTKHDMNYYYYYYEENVSHHMIHVHIQIKKTYKRSQYPNLDL